jgi:hypothetical protein
MTPKIIPFSHPFMIQAPFVGADILNAAQALVDGMIPPSLWSIVPDEAETVTHRLKNALPLFSHTPVDEIGDSFAITYLCPAESAEKAKRLMAELTTWPLVGSFTLHFQFVQDASQKFFIAQEIFSLQDEETKNTIKRTLPELIAQLKEKFSSEFNASSDHIVHPVFMPRNEEEMIRNLILLSSQIKYVKDLPQVSIHFEKQTETSLFFTVILARLLRGKLEPLRKLLEKSRLKMGIDDVRVMGYLKQKYPKEAAVIHVCLDKKTFFRANRSVDLLKARQKVASELALCIGEFRDFNGGMILKQEEALALLKKELGKMSRQQEFLLEEYFYSLKPAIMRTVHDTPLLKRHFELLNEVLTADLKFEPYRFYFEPMGKFLLCYLAARSSGFKEPLTTALATLELSSRDVTSSFLEIGETATMGFIVKAESSELAFKFQRIAVAAMREWATP